MTVPLARVTAAEIGRLVGAHLRLVSGAQALAREADANPATRHLAVALHAALADAATSCPGDAA